MRRLVGHLAVAAKRETQSLTRMEYPSVAKDESRQSISFDGRWAFALDPKNIGEKENWWGTDKALPGTIQVPGCWQAHPIQCDNPQLVTEFAQLNAKPAEYHVAVNNPTDAPIKTVLKKCMDLPGFEFADTAVDVPPGGYQVIRAK